MQQLDRYIANILLYIVYNILFLISTICFKIYKNCVIEINHFTPIPQFVYFCSL